MKTIDDFIDHAIEPDVADRMRESSSVVCSALPGNPVLFVSDAFETHTGYAPAEVVGKNLSMLQGKATEPSAVQRFRTLLREERAGVIRISNYRADGSLFVQECDLRPVRDKNDVVTHFIAIQKLV